MVKLLVLYVKKTKLSVSTLTSISNFSIGYIRTLEIYFSVTNALNGSTLPVAECVTCSSGFIPSSDKTTCESCNLKSFSTNRKLCDCDSKQTQINNICIPNSFIKNTTIFMPTTISGESFHSTYFDANSISSLYMCSVSMLV